MPPASFFYAESALKSLTAGPRGNVQRSPDPIAGPHSWVKREGEGLMDRSGEGRRDSGGRERSCCCLQLLWGIIGPAEYQKPIA